MAEVVIKRNTENDEIILKKYMSNNDNRHYVKNIDDSSRDKFTALAVDIEINNKGYGTALAIFMTNEILNRGNSKAYLCVESKNANAYHIYEKIGYKAIENVYGASKKVK